MKDKLKNPLLIKVLLIGVLILLQKIPLSEIQSLIWERTQTRYKAINELAQTLGGEQLVGTPVISVPFMIYPRQKNNEGNDPSVMSIRGSGIKYYAYLFPDRSLFNAELRIDKRYRGIFEIPSYLATLSLSGSFSPNLIKPIFQEVAGDLLWDEATLSLEIRDTVAIKEIVKLGWNDREVDFEPGIELPFAKNGIHVKLKGLISDSSSPQEYNLKLLLSGTEALSFIPYGKNTELQITSDWPDPSFIGAYLPLTQNVSKDGFKALWKIPDLGSGLKRVIYGWELDVSKMSRSSSNANPGVRFLSMVDGYRMSDRAIKYDLLFITLTYLVFFMFEVFTKLRIHPMQYLMVGAALSLFYLLLLSVSEVTGFMVGYAISSAAAILLVSGYSAAFLSKVKGRGIIPCLLASLYGFLYALLSEQNYSLLIGSVGLTVVLAVIMYSTRRINWYHLSDEMVVKAQ